MNCSRSVRRNKQFKGVEKRTYAGNNMPWVEEEYRYYNPKNICREKRNDQCEEELVLVEISPIENFICRFNLD